MRLRLVGLGIATGLCLLVSIPAASAMPPDVRAGMLRVTDLLLNLDTDAAEAECRHLHALSQGEAAGRFCESLVTLTRATDLDDPTPALKQFLTQAEAAVKAATVQERADPGDAEVHLLLALAHGSRAMVNGEQKDYFTALGDLRDANRQFAEALRLDPQLVDAYYGIGLYGYSVAHLPRLLKPLVSLVAPAENPERGLQDLERVAGQGTYLKMLARLVLLDLYVGREGRYADALRLGQELLRRYPGNPDLYFATAYAASKLGHFAEALEIAGQLSRNMAEGQSHFGPELLARYNQLLGKTYMDRGDYGTALTYFQRAIEAPTPVRYHWVTAWAWTRSGMIHDLQGDRKEAVRRYRKALDVSAGGLAGDLARRYLDAPYRGEEEPPTS